MIFFTDPTRFITDPDFCYQEFARREEDHFQVFRVQVRIRHLYVSGSRRHQYSQRNCLFLAGPVKYYTSNILLLMPTMCLMIWNY